jgi:diguanylate cyclase (GGDEF)-like protein/PAS domain S-box-containing protein
VSADAPDAVVQQAMRDGELHKALFDQLEEGIYIVDRSRRILYWNAGAEGITGYLMHEVAGQLCHGDLLLDCDAEGMAPDSERNNEGHQLTAVMLDGRPREGTVFLRHRQGHRVPVHLRSRAIHDSEGIVVGALEVFKEVKAQARVEARILQEHGCLDQLTRVATRTYAEMRLKQALEALRTFGIPFGWLMVELDDVDQLEQRYGHGMVEAAVKLVARTLDGNLGALDLLSYWDRGQFRIEVHSCWRDGPAGLAQKLVGLARASHLEWWGDRLQVTVSIGGGMGGGGDSEETLEARAAGALANCRASGGNRAAVVHFEGDVPEAG